VREFIRKFLSKTRNVVIIVILLIAAIAAAYYVVKGIQQNVELMTNVDEEVSYFPEYPKVNAVGPNADLIKRGDYLVKAGDCIACHTNTPEKGPAFAGGLPMQTPFGVIYTSNITPDKETGIGGWTDDQFIKAMREGVSPRGHNYYPAFPYLYFNKVTTEDLLAIKAYLDHLPAVKQKNKENKMVWPFNWRFLQSGWRALFFNPVKTGPFQPDPDESEQWNRGAYLVEGLGHCAMCHTPSYHIVSDKLPLGAPIRKYNLIGSKVQGYLAPNITKANLDKISEEELIRVFTHNELIGGGKVEGPMLEANQDSLKYLTRSDLLAIATYLKSVKSKSLPKPTGNIGKAIYQNYCSGCHTSGGGGAPRYGDASAWVPILEKGKETIYKNAIVGIGGMPAKGTCVTCEENEIKLSVDYMLAAVEGKKATVVEKPKKLTLEDGKHIYDKNCSVCHANGFKNAPKPGDMKAWEPIVDAGFLQAYENVMTGQQGHPLHGACPDCTDAEVIAAIKYMMTTSSKNKNYDLW
jgi:cytochrome c5